MRFKRFGLKPIIAAATSAAIVVGCTLPIVTTSNKASTSTSETSQVVNDAKVSSNAYTYEPITIASGYNANTIAGASGDTTATAAGWRNVQACDDNASRTNDAIISAEKSTGFNAASLYLKNANSSGGLTNPDSDGYTYITSEHAPSGVEGDPVPTWKIPVSKTSASTLNTLKLFKSSPTGTLTFKDLGVYNKLYILCLVTQCKGKDTPEKFNATITYTDGSSTSKEDYEAYDWFPEDNYQTLLDKNQVATTTYGRFWYYGSGSKVTKKWNDGSGSNEVVFNQCAIEVDPYKMISKMDIALDTSQWYDDAVLNVYAVAGRTADISAPESSSLKIAVDSATYTKADITWDAVTDATEYYMDVSTDSTFSDETKFVSGLKNAKVWNSTTGGDLKYTITGLTPNTTYYVRMRAANTTGQSANSNTVSFKTAVKATSLDLDPTQLTLKTGNTSTVTSKVNGISGYVPENQSVTWTGTGTIASATTSSTDVTKHTIKGLKPGKVTLTATSADDTSKTKDLIVTVNANEPTITSLSDVSYNSMKVNFTEPTEASDSNYSYQIEYSSDNWSTITTKNEPHNTSKTHTVTLDNLTALTTYKVRVKTLYTGGYDSDYSTEKSTTTTAIPAVKISMPSKASINVLESTSIQSTIYGPGTSSLLASNQEVVWTSDVANWKQYLSITTTGESTKTQTHTIKALQAYQSQSGTITLKATAKDYSTVYATIDVTIKLPGPTFTSITSSSSSLTVSWTKVAAATSYKIGYESRDGSTSWTEVANIDKGWAGLPYTIYDDNLRPNTLYDVYVYACNNNVDSTPDHIEGSTQPQEATGLTISPTSFETILGATTTITSQVLGGTYEATNQNVTSAKTSGTGDVKTTDSGKTHTIKATQEGNVVVTYTSVDGSYTADCNVTVKGINALDASGIDSYSFVANWENIGAQKYYIQVATDENFNNILPNYNGVSTTSNSMTIMGLSTTTQYFYRVWYENNGYTSSYSNVKTATTTTDVTDLILDKNELSLDVKKNGDVTATIVTSDPNGKSVEWTIDDESIATITETKLENGVSTVNIKGLKIGSTTLHAKVANYPEIGERTCTINIDREDLLVPDPHVKDITTDGFTIYWDGTNYEFGTKFAIHVWTINAETKEIEEVAMDKMTEKYEIRISSSEFSHLTPGRKYYFTVEALYENSAAKSETKVVQLPSPMPGWIMPLTITTGTVAGFFLIILPLLYLLWKYGLIRTIDPKKAKKKLANKENNAIDKFFRAEDKFWVKFNRAVSKQKRGTTLVEYGTRPEQKLKK